MKRPVIGYLSRAVSGDQELIDQLHLYAAADELGYMVIALVYADHDVSAARLMNYVWAERADAVLAPTMAHLGAETAAAVAKQTSVIYVDTSNRSARPEKPTASEHLSLVLDRRSDSH